MQELQPVVLTGLGAVTAQGDFTLHGPPPPAPEVPIGAIENFRLEAYLDSPKTYLDRCTALALAGGALALRDAGLAWPVAADAARCGITLGTHLGCINTMKGFWDKAIERGVRLANPLLFSHSYFNTPISLCAIEFGLKGYHTTFCAGHASGLEAVRAAHDAIRLGHAGAMLCGGVEALTPTRARCEPVQEAPLSEAAVFFVLESRAHAEARGALPGGAVNDQIFEVAAAQGGAARARFGDCGGAHSALALLLALAAADICPAPA